MEAYQIIAGFSDIKSEFRTSAGIKKSQSALQLLFRFREDILWVHDFDAHEKKMILALFNPNHNLWKITLWKGGPGERLIKHVTTKFERDKLEEELMELYSFFGYIPFRRF